MLHLRRRQQCPSLTRREPTGGSMSEELAIRVRGLTKRYKQVVAVNNLHLDIPTGTVYGFLGPNGAGKTTTIRMLLGLVRPTSGRAEVLGQDILKGDRKSVV